MSLFWRPFITNIYWGQVLTNRAELHLMLVCLCQDWNTFLLRFNELDFCVSENETIKHGLNESTTPESMVVTSGQARSITQAPVLLEDSGPINISVPITLTLDPQRPFGGYSRNLTHLYATVLGQQVGLSGEFSASLPVSSVCLQSGLLQRQHVSVVHKCNFFRSHSYWNTWVYDRNQATSNDYTFSRCRLWQQMFGALFKNGFSMDDILEKRAVNTE